MSIIKYKIGDTYPDLKGVVSYAGSVETELMGADILANSEETGPFTGAVTRTGGDSDNSALSTFRWRFAVTSQDTLVEGVYDLCLKITHFDGQVETINANATVEVVANCV